MTDKSDNTARLLDNVLAESGALDIIIAMSLAPPRQDIEFSVTLCRVMLDIIRQSNPLRRVRSYKLSLLGDALALTNTQKSADRSATLQCGSE